GRGGNERHAGPKPYRRRDGKADDGHLRFFLLPPGSSQIHWQNIHFSQRRIPSRHRHSRKSANRGARVSMASRSLSLSKLLVEPRVRIDYYVNKIRIVGLGWTVRWIARRIAVEIMWVVLLPITVLAHLAGYRRVSIFVERVGHLASEFDGFLKERALGWLPTRRWFVVAPRRAVANPCLLDYWKRHVSIIQSPWSCA